MLFFVIPVCDVKYRNRNSGSDFLFVEASGWSSAGIGLFWYMRDQSVRCNTMKSRRDDIIIEKQIQFHQKPRRGDMIRPDHKRNTRHDKNKTHPGLAQEHITPQTISATR